ncbi:MAG: hypothetical protein ACFFDV_06550 [Candidatus Thorarchaeota archaeon]
MSIVTELKSWSWIPKTVAILYPMLLFAGIFIGTFLNPGYYWIAMIIGVPSVVIPITYRKLVGGGCSLRFHICALVKGMLAGFVFLILAMSLDIVAWQLLGTGLGWSQITLEISQEIYLVWLFSGTIGGFGARIVEVRGQTRTAEITIAGFE